MTAENLTPVQEVRDLPDVTPYLLDELEFRYADPRVCRACGAPLQVGDSRGMKMTCTSDAASAFKSRHEAAGVTWKQAMDHWQESTMYNPPEGDRRVVALVRAYRAAVLRDAPDTTKGSHQ
jgi:hypothetical protein